MSGLLPQDEDKDKETPAMGRGGNSDEESEDDEDDECPENPGYGAMFKASNARKFLGKSWVVFSMFFGLYYLIQFGLALGCANYYSMSEDVRLTSFVYIPTPVQGDDGSLIVKQSEVNAPLQPCGLDGNKVNKKLEKSDKDAWVKLQEESAWVYDKAFFLMGLFHIIEWIRTIVLLTSTCMGGEFLIVLYQWTSINAIFGFIAYVFAHYALFSADGQSCAGERSHDSRRTFLTVEIIFFYVVYTVGICFVLMFPKVAFELAHGSWRKRDATR